MHVVWYTAASIDGRIADPRHSLDFLDSIGRGDDREDDFPAFLASINAVLVGAATLRWLLRGGHGWPHDDLPTWLVSHDADLVRQAGVSRAPFQRVEGPLDSAFEQMGTAGHERVWLCGGGAVAAQSLELDRIDEIVVTIAPTALGAGPSLFDGDQVQWRRFRLAECRPFGGDAARLRWLRDRASSDDRVSWQRPVAP